MISRRVLVVLVATLAVLVAAFSVLMGFYLLSSALGDRAVATALRWAGGACGILAVTDFVLLVAALAIHGIDQGE